MTVLLCILAFMMLSVSLYIYENSIYCRKTIENLIESGTGRSGVIASVNDSEFDMFAQFRNELYKSDLITKAGYITTASGFGETEFGQLQAKLEGRQDDSFEYVYMDSSAMDFYKIELEEGSIDKDMPYDETMHYLYLGSAYKEYYKIGDEIQYNIYDDVVFKFVVKGFLAENTRIIDDETLFSSDAFTNDKCYVTLSDAGVIIECNYSSLCDAMFYSWKEGCSAQEAEQEVKTIAGKYGLSVITARIDDILEEKEESCREINSFILNILGIVLVTTVVLLICVHISAVFSNLSEYGIMYANGFGIGHLAFMLFIELFFKMVIVCGCSLAFTKVLLFEIFYGIEGQVEVYNDIFYRYVVPYNILSGIIILIIAFVIPFIVLVQQKPINLIGGNDT